MLVRSERSEDRAEVEKLITAAFGRGDEAKLIDQLSVNGDLALSLVALKSGVAVGHVAFSRLRSPPGAWALAPVAVTPEWQRRGIGAALVEAGLQAARERGVPIVFVLGEPDYYGRFGFKAERAAGFASSYSGPYLMALALGDAAPRSGALIYPPAFSALT
jgi:putative acetyltransferase